MDVLYDKVNSVSPCLVTYRHLSKFSLSEGDLFEKGTVLALTGNTAGTPSSGRRGSTGAHLHVEVRVPEMAYMSEPALRDAKVPGKHWKLVPAESVIANA
jgi:murein DD-endopeptidase MepM/ murein hydrolase activator NlpD